MKIYLYVSFHNMLFALAMHIFNYEPIYKIWLTPFWECYEFIFKKSEWGYSNFVNLSKFDSVQVQIANWESFEQVLSNGCL